MYVKMFERAGKLDNDKIVFDKESTEAFINETIESYLLVKNGEQPHSPRNANSGKNVYCYLERQSERGTSFAAVKQTVPFIDLKVYR